MARDWDKLAGEKGRVVPSGRIGRLMRMGRLGMSVSASTVARTVGKVLLPGSDESRAAADGDFRTRQAQKVLKVLGELKGATMKVGQILSSDPELVPPEFSEALSALQHQAPPMTWRQVKDVLEDAFDRPVESVFSYFDPEPIGSASIGQVHRATLASGEDVAVKIQYPGIAETLESDMRNLGSLLNLGRVLIDRERLNAYLAEVRRTILEESDYVGEAEKLAHFHDVFEARAWTEPVVRVPRPFVEWTRPNVLTMELVEGTKLDEALAAMPDEADRLPYLARFVDIYAWMFHELGELHADPHPGNFLLTEDGAMVVLDFGCVKTTPMALGDGILDVMDACWQHDDQRAARLYREMVFGKAGADPAIFDPKLLRAYHEIMLAPFLTDGPFAFGDWDLRVRMRRFVWEHPAFLKLHPPPDLLMVGRVMGGIKGLLTKLDAHLDVHTMAVETARRRGRFTAPPKLS